MDRNERQKRRRQQKREEFFDFFSSAGDFEDEDEKRERLRQERRERNRAAYNGRRRKKRSVIGPVLAFLTIVVIAAVVVGVKLVDYYSYSKTVRPLEEYYAISGAEDVPVIMEGAVSDTRLIQRNGYLYIPLSFVRENINSRFFYDAGERLLLYTTPYSVYLFNEDRAEYTADGQTYATNAPVWFMSGDEPYMELSFLSDYGNFVCDRFEEPLRVCMRLHDEDVVCTTALKKTQIRYQGGVKSDVLRQVAEGEKLTVLEELEDWSKVMSEDGVIGYMEKKHMSERFDETLSVPQTYLDPIYPSLTRDHKINMAWHQVTNQTANEKVFELLDRTKAVNVISPTWYFLSDDSGGFTTIADASYVSAMHERGLEVWALIDNFTNKVDTAAVLSSYTNRQRLINELTQSAVSYGIDGINVDFELVPASAGGDYTQFIRELSIACRKNNLVLSVDNYVPTDYSDYYNRGEQGVVADYVVIMGYDEHYAGSAEAGSVASLGYVQGGIEKTIAQVPSHKIINGIPFYTRFWRSGDGEVESEALTMTVAKQSLDSRGITPEWDDTTSQYYAGFEEDGKFCQIWLEEQESIAAKLSVMSQYDLGGVAEWKLGQEDPVVWDEIEKYMGD